MVFTYCKKYSFLLALTAMAFCAHASDTLQLTAVRERVSLRNNPAVFAVEAKAGYSYETIHKADGWKPFDSVFISQSPSRFWLRATLHNADTTLRQFVLANPGNDTVAVFLQTPDTLLKHLSGIFIKRKNLQYDYDRQANSIKVPAGQTVHLLVYVYNEENSDFLYDFDIQTFEYYARTLAGNYIYYAAESQYHAFLLGALAFAAFFMALMSIWFRNRSFLYYVLFLAGAILYLWPKSPFFSYLGLRALELGTLRMELSETMQFFFYAAYTAFGVSLLDLKRYRGLYNYFRAIIWAFLIYALVLGIWLVMSPRARVPLEIFNANRIIVFPLVIIGLVWIIQKVQSPLKHFYLAGSGLFIAFSLLAAIRQAIGGITISSTFSPLNLLKTGILLEALAFGVALGYKMYLIEKDKRDHYKAYISQLELNEQLMKNMNTQLEATVAERTKELEEEKEKQLRLEYEQRLTQLEMQALRSQMNPHFIFNSLNSIRYQIQSQQYKSASDYLLKFSKLLRLTLENSRKDTVTLEEELQLTRLYLDIEGQRFADEYHYDIIVDEASDCEDINLPPLLLQPYVENAIKHGLMNSTKTFKQILINVRADQDNCLISIEDNGIGRRASAVRQHSDGLEHHSLGMQITDERMAIYSKKYGHKLAAHIQDLEKDGQPAGTRVTITYNPKHYV